MWLDRGSVSIVMADSSTPARMLEKPDLFSALITDQCDPVDPVDPIDPVDPTPTPVADGRGGGTILTGSGAGAGAGAGADVGSDAGGDGSGAAGGTAGTTGATAGTAAGSGTATAEGEQPTQLAFGGDITGRLSMLSLALIGLGASVLAQARLRRRED